MNPDNFVYKAFYLLAQNREWSSWAYQKNRPAINVADLGAVTVIHTVEDSRSTNYYDEYSQGSTAPAGLVFKVVPLDGGPARYFEKNGTYDSYGSASYEGGEFFEVTPKPVETTAYVRV